MSSAKSMGRKAVASFAATMICVPFGSAYADCGIPGTITGKRGDDTVQLKTRVFADGSIAVKARLAVNPDGGPGSYTVGNHGFTYIGNGLALWKNNARVKCDTQCTNDFKTAEGLDFAKGSAEFCVFAIEVEPISGGARTSCKNGYVAGNGKGRPALGPLLTTAVGGNVRSYRSTTSLMHLVGGQSVYLNSETLPIVVTPDADLLGRVAMVVEDRGAVGGSTPAIIGDAGPAFGEGSIALHQMLRYGSIGFQKVGPILPANRCGPEELGLRPPFVSKPDGGSGDLCRPGYRPKTVTDIRAYAGMDQDVDFVILGKAFFPRKGLTVQSEVTVAAINAVVEHAGYSPDAIAKMRNCLNN